MLIIQIVCVIHVELSSLVMYLAAWFFIKARCKVWCLIFSLCLVSVMLQPFDFLPHELARMNHKFMVQTLRVPDGSMESEDQLVSYSLYMYLILWNAYYSCELIFASQLLSIYSWDFIFAILYNLFYNPYSSNFWWGLLKLTWK